MKEGKGRGKEREVPTHLIENSKLSHAARVTKNKTRMGETNHADQVRLRADRARSSWCLPFDRWYKRSTSSPGRSSLLQHIIGL